MRTLPLGMHLIGQYDRNIPLFLRYQHEWELGDVVELCNTSQSMQCGEPRKLGLQDVSIGAFQKRMLAEPDQHTIQNINTLQVS